MRRRWLAAVLLVAAAAALPYVQVVNDYFIQDDFGVVSLLSQKPWSAFPGWFVSTWMDDIWGFTPDEIRPFPALSYQVAAIWGAGSPVANHVINIAFHVANVLLVLAIAQRVAGLTLPSATSAALVFAVLPMHPETVAWITGRVDSMPACFYLAAFLLYARWRDTGRAGLYAGSVACCFAALFSKQNTITLPAALVLYDLVVRRDSTINARAIVRYVPFVALTAGYLILRGVVFGEVAREGMLTAERLSVALGDLSTHLRRMMYGPWGLSIDPLRAFLQVAAAAIVVAVAVFHVQQSNAGRLARLALFFAGIWVALGAAPTLVAGYASPRHMYLAATGWAIGIGIAAEALWSTSHRWLRWTARLAVAALVVAYTAQLLSAVGEWRLRAAVSARAVADLEREVRAAPDGTLFLVGAPRSSWEYAVPHALRPPFTTTDLTTRAAFVTHSSLSCCPASQWNDDTRTLLRSWLAHPASPPLVALHWDPRDGTLTRLTDREEPTLRWVAGVLPDTGSGAALDEAILDTFNDIVVPRGQRLADRPRQAGLDR